MNASENRHLRALELEKVLLELSRLTSCEDSASMALSLYPDNKLSHVQYQMGLTSAAYELLAKYGGPSFSHPVNVNNIIARAKAGGALSERELLSVGEDLRIIRSLSEWRRRLTGAESVLDPLFSALTPDKYLEDRIFTSITNDGEISDNASSALAEIRRKIRFQSAKVRERLESLTRSETYKKYLQDAIITQRNGRFVVPVKSEYRSNIPGLVHDTSSSGATVFIEPMGVVEANNEIRVLQGQEQDEITRILYELSAAVAETGDSIKFSYENILELDLIFAKAQLAYAQKASVPELNDSGEISLRRARHPLLDQKTAVPIDVSLGGEFDTLVITGPNTGGKTVTLKTIGLLTAMAMCGLMIPVADQSKICVFNEIFADIGDEQSIEQSLSTFSAHMVNIVDILNNAGEGSLVLIDELGAGTDPVEGAALAVAILERLHEKGAKTAATTHYAELKAYAISTPYAQNGCCEFDVSTLRPTYRLLIGVPGRSNAFAITQRLGMEQSVVDRARELVSAEDTKFEDVMDSIEQSRLEMERAKNEAERLQAQNEELKKQSETRLSDLEEIREKEIQRARGEAMRIVEDARRQSNALLLEIDKLRKELKSENVSRDTLQSAKSAVKRGLDEIDNAMSPVLDSTDELYTPPRPIRVGDTVTVSGMTRECVVLSIKGQSAQVSQGSMKLNVKLSSLRLVEKKNGDDSKKQGAVTTNTSRADSAADTRCDLRGLTSDDAIFTLDGFIDSMVVSGIKEFTIIHGKGTGALRAAVQKHLKNHPAVKSYRLGTFGEGESGVTIATLK